LRGENEGPVKHSGKTFGFEKCSRQEKKKRRIKHPLRKEKNLSWNTEPGFAEKELSAGKGVNVCDLLVKKGKSTRSKKNKETNRKKEEEELEEAKLKLATQI